MEESDKNFYKQEFGINIAVASQMQLINLSNRMITLNINYPVDSPQKQKIYLDLVKQYLICGTPYLSVTDVRKYEKELLEFKINKKIVVRAGTQFLGYEFDPTLDKKLFKIMIDLQIKLRRVFNKIIDEDDDDEGL